MTLLPNITARASGVRVDLRVTPRASKNAIDGVRDGRLVVKVTAPPVDAAANEAVIALMANTLGVPKRQIALVMGATGRSKTIEVSGLSEADLRARLRPAYMKRRGRGWSRALVTKEKSRGRGSAAPPASGKPGV